MTPEARRTLITLAIAVAAIAIGLVALLRPRRIAPERPGALPSGAVKGHDQSLPDAQLEEAARLRLQRSEFANLPIKVQVKDEVIVVNGPVPDKATRERLLDHLRMTPGVKGVVDHTAAAEQPRDPLRNDPQTPGELPPPASNESSPIGPQGPGPN